MFLAVAVLCAAPGALASEGDHERARQAVKRGEVLPLDVMVDRLSRIAPGKLIDVEFERDDGRWVYEFTVLQADGVIREIEMDARTARVLEIEVKGR